jgi:hypothetical protein
LPKTVAVQVNVQCKEVLYVDEKTLNDHYGATSVASAGMSNS